MHKLKTIWRSCECGKMNTVYNAYTVHKFLTYCPICEEASIKHSRDAFAFSRLTAIWDDRQFEEFAISWG